jgi:hypothetical protein
MITFIPAFADGVRIGGGLLSSEPGSPTRRLRLKELVEQCGPLFLKVAVALEPAL